MPAIPNIGNLTKIRMQYYCNIVTKIIEILKNDTRLTILNYPSRLSKMHPSFDVAYFDKLKPVTPFVPIFCPIVFNIEEKFNPRFFSSYLHREFVYILL